MVMTFSLFLAETQPIMAWAEKLLSRGRLKRGIFTLGSPQYHIWLNFKYLIGYLQINMIIYAL